MPNLFNNAESADIHFVYGFCDGNAAAAVREYRRRYPDRRQPNARVFVTMHQRFRDFGLKTVMDRQPRGQINEENAIIRAFNNNPRLSSRRAALQLRKSKSKILRVLHKDNQRPYHLQAVQKLLPGDENRRLTFCNWILNSVQENPQFLHKILWTDESCFTRTGVFNHHNSHIWAQENPRGIRIRSFQHEFSVNVWLGLINGYICGPFFLPPRLNSVLFLDFLTNNLYDLFDDIPAEVRHNSWFQMDGAPAHFGRQVRDWMNENYPERWIGRITNNDPPEVGRGPVAWPARSPDITPLDFYAWGYLKDVVYATTIDTREELIERIQQACHQLSQNRNQILAAINSITKRCQKCIEAGGLHFENML